MVYQISHWNDFSQPKFEERLNIFLVSVYNYVHNLWVQYDNLAANSMK